MLATCLDYFITIYRVLPYGCVATGLNTGFIEVVRRADTIERIHEKYKASHSTRDRKVHVLYQWLIDHNPTENRYMCHMWAFVVHSMLFL